MILKLLGELAEIEIRPYSNILYDTETLKKQGFMYVGTLSPQLQRLGTLMVREKECFEQELSSTMSRKKQVAESTSLTHAQRLYIIEKELPERFEALAKQHMIVDFLIKIFSFEISCELLLSAREVPDDATAVKIFGNWEVAVGSEVIKSIEHTSPTESKELKWPKMPTLTIM